MNKKTNFKKFAAACMLAASVVGIPTAASADEVVKVIGEGNVILGVHPTSSVDHIEFGESAPSIVIPLSENVSFKMIKVEGGVPYTLRQAKFDGVTGEFTEFIPVAGGEWGEDGAGATKMMEDYWIGEFEVTQGVWKEVMGVTDEDLSSQSIIGDDYPIGCISWNMLCTGDNNFFTKINERLKELKASDPELAAVIGDREFRLPNFWEWQYAASGGKDFETLNYCYSGISESTIDALLKVAVSAFDQKTTHAAKVGTKAPNALGLYDMSGNQWEHLSGLGNPGHENTPGAMFYNGRWSDTGRIIVSGSWHENKNTQETYYMVSYGANYGAATAYNTMGFRLAL